MTPNSCMETQSVEADPIRPRTVAGGRAAADPVPAADQHNTNL